MCALEQVDYTEDYCIIVLFCGFHRGSQPVSLVKEDQLGRLYWLLMIAGVAALLIMSACGSAGSPPTPISIDDACALEKDDQQATVIGYFQPSFMVFCTESCTLKFAETPDGESPLSPDVKVGSGRNQMRELPDDFQEADFHFTTQDDAVLGLSDQVQITGKMSIASDVCLMYVDRILAAP